MTPALPLEVVLEILVWIPLPNLFKYRRLSAMTNNFISTLAFARKALRRTFGPPNAPFIFKTPRSRNAFGSTVPEPKISKEKLFFSIVPTAFQEAIATLYFKHNSCMRTNLLRMDSNRLPLALCQMTQLKYLEIVGVEWHDIESLPSQINKLVNLKYLRLSLGRIMGPLPMELGQMTTLQDVKIVRMHLSDLSFNALIGSIPREIGNLRNLILLNLAHNKLTGSIPKEFGQLKELHSLYLHHNKLSGDIPNELGNLLQLYNLGLAFNLLTGPVPSSFQSLGRLNLFDMCPDQISCAIPEELLQYLTRVGFHCSVNEDPCYFEERVAPSGIIQVFGTTSRPTGRIYSRNAYRIQ
ncbi:L domain-like protein [Rhizoclosmatium globosum]|uniref:L domain-like protein n=1 Tax=Rhizoclosmatium globosum TaxID=329046 RepID=A0A1Y2CDW1_9FUNG|nr:L domain-like protein [Rhizoclosmatium globosum]|eukprot:ORY45077.1 L domain-like protein [Rhizoclosmatium globosum]